MTEVSEVLKPCPFCGHAATVSEPAPDNWHTWSISCDHCPTPLQPLGSIADDRDAAIVAWNTRPTLASEQTELVEQIRRRIWSITGCSDGLAEQAAEAVADDLIEALSSVPTSNAGWIEFIRRIGPHIDLGPLNHEDRDVVLFGALPSSVPTPNSDETDYCQKLRMVISHATGGRLSEPEDVDRSINDICVRISAHKNDVWNHAQEVARRPTSNTLAIAREALSEARELIGRVSKSFLPSVCNQVIATIDKALAAMEQPR